MTPAEQQGLEKRVEDLERDVLDIRKGLAIYGQALDFLFEKAGIRMPEPLPEGDEP